MQVFSFCINLFLAFVICPVLKLRFATELRFIVLVIISYGCIGNLLPAKNMNHKTIAINPKPDIVKPPKKGFAYWLAQNNYITHKTQNIAILFNPALSCINLVSY